MTRTARPLGEWALLVECPSMADAHAVRRAMAADLPDAEVVCGDGSVLVEIQPEDADAAVDRELTAPAQLDRAARLAAELPVTTAEPFSGELVEVPVRYDGADLRDVAALCGLSPDEVIALHAGTVYTVAFIGFSPGFAYLDGLVERLAAVPRLATPRERVPAGTVAIANGRTAVYPQSTPGGWRALGTTDLAVFDPARPAPALLTPGARVRFVPR